MRNPKRSKKKKKCEIRTCGTCTWFGRECFFLEGETQNRENKKSEACWNHAFKKEWK